jgi:ribonuclease HI
MMRSQERLTTSVARPVDIFFDASVRQDPESTAIGFVIEASDGRKLATKGQSTELLANTQAEYLALLEALRTAARYPGIDHVHVYGDCKSVIDVLNPESEANPNRADIAAFAKQARELLAKFAHAELRYISREKNKLADRLAYVGHKERVTTVPSLPNTQRYSLPPSRRRGGTPAGD